MRDGKYQVFQNGVVNTGHPDNWFTGIPIDIGGDRAGNRIIFWSRGEVGCGLCSGKGSHQEWLRHMRFHEVREPTEHGILVRTVLRCPQVPLSTVLRTAPQLSRPPSFF